MTPTVPLPLSSVVLYLRTRGLASAPFKDVLVIRGVGDAADLATIRAGRALVLTRGGGPGLRYEMHFDQPVVTVRSIGKQKDYDSGEQLAAAIDAWMLSPEPVDVGGRRALYVVRAGGGPTHFFTDKARRAHFSCSYIIPVASGL